MAGHRVLAINRGENEKLLVIKVEAPEEKILSWLERQIITCLQKRSDRTYG